MATESRDLHIVMLPWSAFGHMIPFYNLATALGKQGVRVTYISTPRNIERLPKIPPNVASLVEYVSLPLPNGSSLPEGAEATVDLEDDQHPLLTSSFNQLREPFKQFVLSNSPDWIISDFTAHWMPDIAQECQVQLMYFIVLTATTICPATPEDREDSLSKRAIANKITDGQKIALGKLLQLGQAVGVRSCREFEGDKIDLLQTLIHTPVMPVGVLPAPKCEEEGISNNGPWKEVFKWLDQQSPGSVIYVGFGSEYKLTKHEVYEIAYGLEIAQLPFIWALREPIWATDESAALPPGFATRTSGKGIVTLGWAPQLQILAHRSIGGSLFHSGWGSIIETLQHGHKLILLPFINDQGLNAQLMVEKGFGIQVERREDGSYTRNDVADALRRAMFGDEAHTIKIQVKKAAEIFGDHKLHQEHYMQEFVKFLQKERKFN